MVRVLLLFVAMCLAGCQTSTVETSGLAREFPASQWSGNRGGKHVALRCKGPECGAPAVVEVAQIFISPNDVDFDMKSGQSFEAAMRSNDFIRRSFASQMRVFLNERHANVTLIQFQYFQTQSYAGYKAAAEKDGKKVSVAEFRFYKNEIYVLEAITGSIDQSRLLLARLARSYSVNPVN